jgi:phage repressor protein C with HTH and peptisase S24 domain
MIQRYNGHLPAVSMGTMGKRHIDDGQANRRSPLMANDWRNRLQEELARQARDMKEVSLSAGLGETYIRDALKRGRGGKVENLQKIARALNKPENWLLAGNGPLISSFDPDEPDDADEHLEAAHRTDFPKDAIIELAPKGGLGHGEIAATSLTREIDGVTEVDAIRPDYWRFPQRFLNETLNRSAKALIVIECEGDSMRPTLGPGERVWVDTSHRIPSPDGIYALRDRFDNIVVKRIQLDDNSDSPAVLILSDNPSHQPIRRSLDELHIVGKVIGGFRLF